jgi:hypothetical protein
MDIEGIAGVPQRRRCALYSSSGIISKVLLLHRPSNSSLYDSIQIDRSGLEEEKALRADPGAQDDDKPVAET